MVAVRASTPDGEKRFEADHVINTMPVRTLVRVAAARGSRRRARIGRGLGYRDFLVVALMLDRSDLFPDNWIYIHTPGVMVGRIQNFNNWSRAMVPVPGMTCLGMEYFCFEGDGLWASPDAELVKRAATELEALGLARASDVKDGTVIRMPEGLPDLRFGNTAIASTAFGASSIRFRTCIRLGATVCTSTTTRIIRCSPRCSQCRT
mgnify:CR=1 FL=1